MLVQALPDTMTKLAQMGEATLYEPAGDQPQTERRRVPYQSRSLAECITNVVTPKGKKPILKVMVTAMTPKSELSAVPTFGVATTLHAWPFQCSVSV